MTIFDIDEAILSCVDMETGEIIDPERLNALQMERERKIENVAMWKKDCDAQAEAIAAEIRKLQARKQACENRSESLKNYLSTVLEGKKFKTARVAISYRASKAAVIDDLKQVPADYLRYKDPEPDKKAITDAIKGGKDVAGAHLEERVSLIIK